MKSLFETASLQEMLLDKMPTSQKNKIFGRLPSPTAWFKHSAPRTSLRKVSKLCILLFICLLLYGARLWSTGDTTWAIGGGFDYYTPAQDAVPSPDEMTQPFHWQNYTM